MKIAIPIDDSKQAVCVTFGRAPYFMLHDTETGVTELKENPAAQAQGGAGPKAAQFVADSGAEVLLTVRCRENAAQVLKAAEIQIYKTEGSSAEENLKAFLGNKLAELTHFHAGFHGHP